MGTTAVVVTSCTQRKSGRSQVDFAQLPLAPDVERLAKAWRVLIARVQTVGTAEALYLGRSIADTAAAAASLGAPWHVVSAGLGLVGSDQLVPSYECSAVVGSELVGRLNELGATTSDWWGAITAHQPSPLSRLIAQSPTLLALPSSYLRMVFDDLGQVSPSAARQLRIFTSTAGMKFVPEHLASCVMPYDERLESIRNYAGTRSDFAQRALRHFVEVLGATSLSLEEARLAVSVALEGRSLRKRATGVRMSDDEIRQVLRAQWAKYAGSSTRLLRYLRDEAHICCEQKRFGRIWRDLTTEFQMRGLA